MKQTTGNNYRKRLIKVIDYIYHHLDGDLDVNRLAAVAAMSPYHFHRIYRQMAQQTINVTVRRLRLQRAAAELIRSDLPLSAIAKSVSYGSLEAFSRAFTKEFGEPPGQYRASRQSSAVHMEPFVAILPDTQAEYDQMYDVEMMGTDAVSLLGYRHQGDYMNIGQAFEKLSIYAGTNGLFNENTRSIGLYYGDPKSVDVDELQSVACISVQQPMELEGEDAPENLSIPAGRCATVMFKGSYAELEKPYDWLFGKWLPESGHEAADFPPFEEYLNDPRDTPPNELLTRIHCLLA